MRNELRPLQSRCLRRLHHRALPLARFGLTGEAEGGRERREREVEGAGAGGGSFPPLASARRGELEVATR